MIELEKRLVEIQDFKKVTKKSSCLKKNQN